MCRKQSAWVKENRFLGFLNNDTVDFGDPAENYFRSRVLPEGFIDSTEIPGYVVRYFASFDEAIRDFTVEEFRQEDEIIAVYKFILLQR